MPDTKGITPQYQQMQLPDHSDGWKLIASKDGKENSLKIQQDIELYHLALGSEVSAEKKLASNRYGWLQLVSGEIQFNDETLQAGDGVAMDPGIAIRLKAMSPARILFFDLK